MTWCRKGNGKMTIDEIKDYITEYFINNGLSSFDRREIDDWYLDIAATRYQYFGERMLQLYKDDLYNCLFRSHKWFLLEMVNPEVAMYVTDTTRALKGVLDNVDTNLWDLVYQYYDYIGHDKFLALGPWLDEHRDKLFMTNYDII